MKTASFHMKITGFHFKIFNLDYFLILEVFSSVSFFSFLVFVEFFFGSGITLTTLGQG